MIYKDWVVLGESKSLVEVSHRVIKCDTINQVHLSVYNKSKSDQSVIFDIQITNNADGVSFIKQVMHVIQHTKTSKTDCSSDNSGNNLKIDLPASYNPDNVSVTVKFQE